MRTWILTACALLLAGCHRVDFGPYGRLEDPAFILDTVAKRRSIVHGLTGEAKLTVDAPEGSGTLKAAVQCQEPGYVYLETADFFGTPRGTFATNGERFAFYRPDEHRFVEGPATAAELGRYLPVALAPDELVAAMLGELPLLPAEGATMTLDEDTSTYVLELRQGALRQRVTVGTKDLRVLAVETRGAAAYDAFLEDHDELLRDVPFAKRIRLVGPKGTAKVELRYTDVTLNGPWRPEDFVLTAPEGASVERAPPAGSSGTGTGR